MERHRRLVRELNREPAHAGFLSWGKELVDGYLDMPDELQFGKPNECWDGSYYMFEINPGIEANVHIEKPWVPSDVCLYVWRDSKARLTYWQAVPDGDWLMAFALLEQHLKDYLGGKYPREGDNS